MALSPDFDHMTSRGLIECPYNMAAGCPQSKSSRTARQKWQCLLQRSLKRYTLPLRVLLVTKTNAATMWETTMQGDEDQDVRLCLRVSDWAATDPRESRVQAAESCCLSVTFTKQTCPLYPAISLRMGDSKRPAFAGQNSA